MSHFERGFVRAGEAAFARLSVGARRAASAAANDAVPLCTSRRAALRMSLMLRQ